MDPVTDRLLVISGVIVAWHFELLPRWALALLALRELAMVGLARYGLAHGLELRINWPGRLAVAPVMGAFFFAMVGLGTLAEVMLYAGLALAARRERPVRGLRVAAAARLRGIPRRREAKPLASSSA